MATSPNKTPRFWFVMDRDGRIGALEVRVATLLPRGALRLGDPDLTLDVSRAAVWLAVRGLSEDCEDLEDEGDDVLPSGDEAAHHGVVIEGAPSAALARAVEAGRFDAATARTFVTRAPMRPTELCASLLGTRVVGWTASGELFRFWESIFGWRQEDDGFTYARDGEGRIRVDDLPPEWRAAMRNVPRLDVDFRALRDLALGDVCTGDDVVLASPAGDGDESALRRRFELHKAAGREAKDASRPDALFKLHEAPWVPDRLVCRGRMLFTEPLATWFPDFDLWVSDWKDRRYYVDARDVTPATLRHHPATLLRDGHTNLRKLVDMTPIFALGSDQREHDRLRSLGARVYTVGFVRTADDWFDAQVEGPGVKRSLSGPFLDIEAAAPKESNGCDRERLIEGILHALSDGRVDQRAMYLAEQWAALAGVESFLLFPADERESYLDSHEASLAEVLARAEAHRGIVEQALAILRDPGPVHDGDFKLPFLGYARFSRREAFELRARGRMTVEVDGKSTLAVAAEQRCILLDAEPRSWQPEAERRRRAKVRPAEPAMPAKTGRWGLGCAGLVVAVLLVVFVFVF